MAILLSEKEILIFIVISDEDNEHCNFRLDPNKMIEYCKKPGAEKALSELLHMLADRVAEGHYDI